MAIRAARVASEREVSTRSMTCSTNNSVAEKPRVTGSLRRAEAEPKMPDVYQVRALRSEDKFRFWLRDRPVRLLHVIIRDHLADAHLVEAAERVAELTVADLAERYLKEHAEVHCKPRTKEAYRWLVVKFVLPKLGKLAINEVEREHIAALHYQHRETPYQANRILEVVRKMFNLAEAWGLRKDGANPCRFAQKYKEQKRERFLTEEEFRCLGQVLSEVEAEDSETLSAVTAIRLLMLTGCRLNEIQMLRWENVDLNAAELRLPDSKTGARMVPLSRAAASVLNALPRSDDNPWVIAGKKPGSHLTDLQHPWRRIRARAGLDNVRIHDLRHSFASRALALGESLSMIGKLLGHTQVQTTARYAHLASDSVKASGSRISDSIGADILGKDMEPDAA